MYASVYLHTNVCRHVCMYYVCMYVGMYVCIYVCNANMYLCMHVSTCIQMYVCRHVCMHVCHANMYLCMHVSTCTQMYVYMYDAYIHVSRHTYRVRVNFPTFTISSGTPEAPCKTKSVLCLDAIDFSFWEETKKNKIEIKIEIKEKQNQNRGYEVPKSN
jgi:hypothetical protein